MDEEAAVREDEEMLFQGLEMRNGPYEERKAKMNEIKHLKMTPVMKYSKMMSG